MCVVILRLIKCWRPSLCVFAIGCEVRADWQRGFAILQWAFSVRPSRCKSHLCSEVMFLYLQVDIVTYSQCSAYVPVCLHVTFKLTKLMLGNDLVIKCVNYMIRQFFSTFSRFFVAVSSMADLWNFLDQWLSKFFSYPPLQTRTLSIPPQQKSHKR